MTPNCQLCGKFTRSDAHRKEFRDLLLCDNCVVKLVNKLRDQLNEQRDIEENLRDRVRYWRKVAAGRLDIAARSARIKELEAENADLKRRLNIYRDHFESGRMLTSGVKTGELE